MILIGIGGNLVSPQHGTPRQTLTAALDALPALCVRVAACSSWYRSAPVPPSDQPWYVNGVAALETALPPLALLERLQALEERFGRVRGARNAARVLDLDILDYHGEVCESAVLTLPHPRLHERGFVLLPLAELAPGWRHPLAGLTAAEMLVYLSPGEEVFPLDD